MAASLAARRVMRYVEEGIAMFTYGFILDNGVNHLREWLPRGRTRTLADLSLVVTSSDLDIVMKASDERLIIVTANGSDFLREIGRYSRTSSRIKCHDSSGLFILMDAHIPHRPFIEVTALLRLGGKQIGWTDVTDNNLVVRLTVDDRVSVDRLPRCFYCAKSQSA
jgi:hypothetical protein